MDAAEFQLMHSAHSHQHSRCRCYWEMYLISPRSRVTCAPLCTFRSYVFGLIRVSMTIQYVLSVLTLCQLLHSLMHSRYTANESYLYTHSRSRDYNVAAICHHHHYHSFIHPFHPIHSRWMGGRRWGEAIVWPIAWQRLQPKHINTINRWIFLGISMPMMTVFATHKYGACGVSLHDLW